MNLPLSLSPHGVVQAFSHSIKAKGTREALWRAPKKLGQPSSLLRQIHAHLRHHGYANNNKNR